MGKEGMFILEGFYTVKEFAELVNTSPRTIQRWCRQGIIKSYKLGHKYFIPCNWTEFKETEGENKK